MCKLICLLLRSCARHHSQLKISGYGLELRPQLHLLVLIGWEHSLLNCIEDDVKLYPQLLEYVFVVATSSCLLLN